ncbi:RNA-binding protein [Kurthia zopfii]|uniref:ASCH domain n=1 Tax=Kurthia zopfii TaxID=1650 RepID=A0A2U3AF86_9BACL|nr:ASCH domain-containing protein [Kurthia zopfii]PWI23190.1 RNA-binding protein [Kurthia zopfii]TDR41371.1 uncharacterized protein YhfF [Kurthia zopfii]STX09876.1 ASCH domain [Kurthia zopfii]VEI07318.1 ASCH domain [Kurthia zopfii]GEK30013.1 RNA-binding protein [Kurthia zopfii]
MKTIEQFWFEFTEKNNISEQCPNAWMFGDGTKEMGDSLGALVVEGVKTATCSAAISYELDHEPLPQIGQYDIVLDGSNQPIAIIKNESVTLMKMNEVTHSFSYLEGEGDRSHKYWYDAHVEFFTNQLKHYNLAFVEDLQVVCEIFEVVHLNK